MLAALLGTNLLQRFKRSCNMRFIPRVPRRKRPQAFPVEALECRILLDATSWTAALPTGRFGDAANWSNGVPGANDRAIFDQLNQDVQLATTVNGNEVPSSFSVGEVTNDGATDIDLLGQTLTTVLLDSNGDPLTAAIDALPAHGALTSLGGNTTKATLLAV